MFAAAAFAGVGVLLVAVMVFLLSSSQSHGRVEIMLVLTRKARSGKDQIILETSDGPITVSVNEVRGVNVKIGIDAPQCVRVHRPDPSERSANREPVPA